MTIVHDTIAAELALLEQETDFPVAPFGYGSDLACASDLEAGMREVDGLSIEALSQAILRRLDCQRGALPDDPDYGIDLRSYLNEGTTTAELRSLAGRIRNEVSKDDRVDRVTVTVAPTSTGSSLRVQLDVQPIDARIGGFSLTLTASSSALLLEELRGRA